LLISTVFDGLAQKKLPEPDLIPYHNKNDKWGFADVNKKIVIPCIYDRVEFFDGEYAIVSTTNWLKGLIDKKGNKILDIKYDGIQVLKG